MDPLNPMSGPHFEPPNAGQFKRAVLKFAPKEFSVDVLEPAKHGGAYSFGLRITPLRNDARSTRSDISWTSDYEVWRRWDDCLYFQDLLESEYSIMSREKRRRLKQGKGIKKAGVYHKSDFAASWDSLPPGPDYQDIATDIHSYLPRLSKKGALFRPNQATIACRGREFEALIRALFQEDSPTLIKELREMEKVRDFFGFWRRDQDRLRKSGISGPKLSPGLYGTVSASSISLATTSTSGGFSEYDTRSMQSRSSFMPAMFLKMRGGDDAESLFTTRDDDASSMITAPPYSVDPPPSLKSPKSPKALKSPMSARRKGDSSGDDGPPAPVTPPRRTDDLSDAASMKFVLEPSDLLIDSPTTEEAPPHVGMIFPRPPKVTTPARIHSQSPRPGPSPPAGGQSPSGTHQSRNSPPIPPLPLASPASVNSSGGGPMPRRPASQASSIASRDHRNGRVFASPLVSPSEEIEEPQYVFLPAAMPSPTTPSTSSYMSPSPTSPTPAQGRHTSQPSRIRVGSGPSPTSHQISPPGSAIRIQFSNSRDGETPTSADAPSMLFSPADDSSSSRPSSWQNSESSHDYPSSVSARQSSVPSPSMKARGPPQRPPRSVEIGNRDRPLQVQPIGILKSARVSGAAHAEEVTRYSASSLETVKPSSVHSGPRRASSPTPPKSNFDRPARISTGLSNAEMVPMEVSDGESFDGTGGSGEPSDLLDEYFDNLTLVNSDHSQSIEVRPRTADSDITPSRESINFMPSADRFPAPFQHRPPGQFHLPWSPPPPPSMHSPELLSRGLTASPTMFAVPKPPSPSASPSSPAVETFAIKAMYGDSIVVLKTDRRSTLAQVRQRVWDKFVNQEGIPLSEDFVLSYKKDRTLTRTGGRQRSHSTSTVSTVSSIGTIDPSQLSFLVMELEWRNVAANCGSKLTLIVLDS